MKNIFKVNDRVLVKKLLADKQLPFLVLNKPEVGTVLEVSFNCGRQSIYEVQLDRDKRIGDKWAVYHWDMNKI